MAFGIWARGSRRVVLIDEQVEGVVVEDELMAVIIGHRTPGFQTTVVLVLLVVVTAIQTCGLTCVGRHEIFVEVVAHSG